VEEPAFPSSDPAGSDVLDGPRDQGFVWEDDGDDEEDAKWGLGSDAAVVGTGAPPVVAVVVARDPGAWFDDTLRSLGRQEYAELSVVVVDNASTESLAGRVTRVLPGATVLRRDADRGFAAAANAALDRVGDAPFLLVCHDDVVLGRDAVTAMVAEAFRANAGVVGAKLVDWRDPSILSSVGLGVDDYGASAELVDAGELDQSQHDQARNVFAVSTACMLVRTDLFRAMGGFREDIPTCGEDVDLCWRTLIAGASVQFCPRAVVRHRRRYEDRRPINRLPASFLLALADVVASVVLGRFHRAGDDLAALASGVAGLPRAFSVRRSIRRYRRTHDRDLQPLVHRGSYRLASLVRTDEGQSRLAVATEGGRGYLRDLTATDSRAATALVIAALVVVVVGTRKLFGGDLPVLREFVDASQGTRALLGEWWTAWRGAGLGESAVPPPVVPGLGIVSAVLLGSVDLPGPGVRVRVVRARAGDAERARQRPSPGAVGLGGRTVVPPAGRHPGGRRTVRRW
jgi:GT2 family glycosyltransferase